MRANRLASGLAAGALLAMSWGDARGAGPGRPASKYPEAPRSETTDDYHGTKVADPFRPLEDPDSPETRAWVEAENAVTYGFLDKIEARPRIKARLTELWDYEKFGVPTRHGDYLYYSRNSGLQNQAVVYLAPTIEAAPKVAIDPNALSGDGTVALSGLDVSEDGRLIAYGTAAAGSDWQEWRVRDPETGKDRPDVLKWIKFSNAAWTKDGAGFYYGRFPEPKAGESLKGANYDQKLYYHKLGADQSEDALVYERPDHKEWQFHAAVTDDGAYLLNVVSKGTDNKYMVLYRPIGDAGPFRTLVENFDHEYSFVDNVGPVFYFKTDRDAPRGKLVAVDTSKGGVDAAREIIPHADETLESVSCVGGRLIARYLKDARTQVKVFEMDGTPVREVEFPGLGTATGFGGRRSDRETYYSFSSFTRPPTVYRYDVATGVSAAVRSPKVAFDPDDYETKQVFYPSKDGTKIPMFLSYKKGTRLDTGMAPTYLYGYGGFNIPVTPAFSPSNLAWMEMGGVHAVANLRGGGEYGEAWHKAGTKLSKQNVFDDFIAAAEYLIREKVTSTPRLGIEGRSNGGLLVGACLTQRPDLYGAALPGVGVLDMLRFHKFTIGWAWVDDYGSSDDPEQFAALRKYSPLHSVKAGTCYPPTMIYTADHDDRVVPAHSFKFAAAMQAAQACDNPILIRIETKAGHGAGKPTSKQIDEAADKWSFLVRTLGVAAPATR